MTVFADTREAWLLLGLDEINRRIMRPRDLALPMDDIAITCGNPPGARGGKKTICTVCRPELSSAGRWEIFVNPYQQDPRVILPALARAAGTIMGLSGPDLREIAAHADGEVEAITAADNLGPYNHKAMIEGRRKKQTTRMVKCECEDCGYSVRLTRKWLQVAVPTCPDKDCNLYGVGMSPCYGEE